MTAIEVVYSDLDGTMVGPGGCFFRDVAKSVTTEPAEALADLLRTGISLVLVSGRSRAQLMEASHIFGAEGFIGEMGGCVAWDHGREVDLLRGAMPHELEGTPVEVMTAAGLPERLFARWPGRLEFHAPWHQGHDADLMLRGNVPLDELHGVLAEEGYDWLRCYDNGVLLGRTVPADAALPCHVYHLMPGGLGKGRAVQIDLARRGLTPDHAIAIGDSVSDLTMAEHVGHMFLTANGAAVVPAAAALAAAMHNVTVTREPVGLGWVQAIRHALGG